MSDEGCSAQNPWMEADIERCREQQVTVARRQSGGGAVYHVSSMAILWHFKNSFRTLVTSIVQSLLVKTTTTDIVIYSCFVILLTTPMATITTGFI